MTPQGPKESLNWWHQTRAALARVFGHVQVRECGLETPIGISEAASDAVVWPAPASGGRENGWTLVTGTQAWQPLAAPKGGGNLDGAALPCVVGDNAVPFLGEGGVHEGKLSALSVEVHAADMRQEFGTAATVLPLSVLFSGGQPCLAPVTLPMPSVHAVSTGLDGVARMTIKRDGRSGVPAFRAPRTWSRLDRITRVPLLCRRAVVLAGVDTQEAFAAERRALAAACKSTVEEVKLLASFPHVPLSLVQQMAVTPDGSALRLWLRPEPLAAGAAWTVARVTIVLGRRRSTGESIRAVLPEPHGPGRKQ